MAMMLIVTTSSIRVKPAICFLYSVARCCSITFPPVERNPLSCPSIFGVSARSMPTFNAPVLRLQLDQTYPCLRMSTFRLIDLRRLNGHRPISQNEILAAGRHKVAPIVRRVHQFVFGPVEIPLALNRSLGRSIVLAQIVLRQGRQPPDRILVYE